MYILGLGQIGGEDSSAVLLKDGEVIGAVAEERISRIKHQGGFPEQAIKWCLEEAKITMGQVDYVAIVDKPWLRLRKRLVNWYGKNLIFYPVYSLYHIFHDEIPTFLDFYKFRNKLKRLSKRKAKIFFVEHHLTHQSSAYFQSPFNESLILSIDARGEYCSAMVSVGRDNKIEILKRREMPHSLGILYAAVTDYLGFKYGSDEYKVMGLASYGKPTFIENFRKIAFYDPNNLFSLDMLYFTFQNGYGFLSDKFYSVFGNPRNKKEEITERHADIAASVQLLLEEIVMKILIDWKDRTNQKNLCLGGGVALNCSMNGKIVKSGLFERVFVFPASGDDGGAFGAAAYIYYSILGASRKRELISALMGPVFDDNVILKELKISKTKYRYIDFPEKEAAMLIADGGIIGWYQGKMEFGPRALGSRSILADSTRSDMKALINKYVKHREEFRPFAPSVKKESQEKYFNIKFDSPFMTFVVEVNEAFKSILPAITHIDGTARVHTVEHETNPLYWSLLDEFEKIKGVPVVLNTSFNIMGEPIVNTPKEALRCFFSTGMDALIIGHYLIKK
jgi:carbamoyltransferase